MKIAKYEYIKASLSVFSLSALQDSVSVIRTLFEYDLEIQELIDYVIENQKYYSKSVAKNNVTHIAIAKFCHCPLCGQGLHFNELNKDQRTVVTDDDGKKYFAVATCRDERECGWQSFSYLPVSLFVRTFFSEKVNKTISDLVGTPHGMSSGFDDE